MIDHMMGMMNRRMGGFFDEDFKRGGVPEDNYSQSSFSHSGMGPSNITGREGSIDPMDNFMREIEREFFGGGFGGLGGSPFERGGFPP